MNGWQGEQDKEMPAKQSQRKAHGGKIARATTVGQPMISSIPPVHVVARTLLCAWNFHLLASLTHHHRHL